uniref:Mitochondrial resolvase Ydc2 catalytic domain-containing protein n=1 Tax=viral metagenome TaxID=1070528 RepID=A0A6C0JL61_9ZZZZ
MKLISFDVGLRNLAYCILEGTNRQDLRITGWDLIDVMAEMGGLDKPLCHKCKKPACWIQRETYACTRHKGASGLTYQKTSLMKKTKEELQTMGSSVNIVGKTKKELVDKLYTHFSGNGWKRCVKSAKQGSVVDLAPAIATSLQTRATQWEHSNLIVFEQQPDKRMLCVQGMLHMWFVAHGYRCKGVSAVHKLTNIITLQDSTKTYKGRKKTGIVHAAQLVPTEELKTFMLKHPKKDDLADCFLQGLWVLENSK